MSFKGPLVGAKGSLPCEVKCAEPCVVTANEPCVMKCEDSRVVIYPPPVVVTFPGPILTTCPQQSIVTSSGPPDINFADSTGVLFKRPQAGAKGSLPCDVKCTEPCVVTANEPCVIKCEDSHVVIYPPPVVVTFPGPILTTCPQQSIVTSSGPPDISLADSTAEVSTASGVTGCLGSQLDTCPPSVVRGRESRYSSKYSYTSQLSRPGNSYRYGRC